MARIIPVIAFLVISYAFVPQVFQGKVMNQGDTSAWKAMAKEANDYNQTHKDEARWTNSMFGGMPTVTINKITTGNYTRLISNVLQKGLEPASYLFLALLGAFLLFLAMGMNPWLAAIGAVSMTFCAYNVQIIVAGHITKTVAIAYMPWVLASIVYAYRSDRLLGSLFFALTVGFQTGANHPQITYYLGFVLIALVLGWFFVAWKEKRLPDFARTTCLIVAGGLLGLATSASHMLPTYEYAKHSMRGGSELSGEGTRDQVKGLDIEYATMWCYDKGESFNMLIPDFYGGGSVAPLSKNSNSYRTLKEKGYNADQVIGQMPLYWGKQPTTVGPMYMGAIALFFFILGLILVRNPLKWTLAGVALIALLLSWGSNFFSFSEFFFKYIPLYNKFRTVSMILVIWQMVVPMLGIYTVWKILEGAYIPKQVNRAMAWALGITAGFCLIMAAFPSLAGNFTGASDAGLPQDLIPSLIRDRKALLRSDSLRSALFISLAAFFVWMGKEKKLKPAWIFAALGLLMITDYLPVAKRYLNENNFITKTSLRNQFVERPVDKYIKEDSTLYYRVLDLSSPSPFMDASPSYHHKSIGGYNAAKLQRYQDIIEHHLTPEIQALINGLQQCTTLEEAAGLFSYSNGATLTPVMNMLNTKYLILSPESMPVENPYAFGNAWVVSAIYPVNSPDEEIMALGKTDLRTTAVIQDPPQEWLNTFSGAASQIELTSYSPNVLEYSARMDKAGVAVFSEIYYPDGWRAWIDGEEVPILRANYVARALLVPAGVHNIRFSFEPGSYKTGLMLSRISSGFILLSLLGTAVFRTVRTSQKKKDTGTLPRA